MPLQVAVGYASLTGPRERNEDFCGLATPDGQELENKGVIAAVADGIGGHKGGREAAEYTVRGLLSDYFATPDTWGVPRAVETVTTALNRWVIAEGSRNAELAGMATTLSVLVLRGRRYYTAHIGDSRIYRLRGGRMEQLTQDHSLVGELVRAGILTAEEARTHPRRNIITRALGTEGDNTPDLLAADLQPGDRFLLCTDGLTGMTRDDEIEKTLLDSQTADEAADRLIQMALDAGGSDNVTLILCTGEEGKPWKQD